MIVKREEKNFIAIQRVHVTTKRLKPLQEVKKAVSATEQCNTRLGKKHMRINPSSICQFGEKVLKRIIKEQLMRSEKSFLQSSLYNL